jgi:hypothetical protein
VRAWLFSLSSFPLSWRILDHLLWPDRTAALHDSGLSCTVRHRATARASDVPRASVLSPMRKGEIEEPIALRKGVLACQAGKMIGSSLEVSSHADNEAGRQVIPTVGECWPDRARTVWLHWLLLISGFRLLGISCVTSPEASEIPPTRTDSKVETFQASGPGGETLASSVI